MIRALGLLVIRAGTIAVCLILVSCSAFESSRKMDMTPFAQNTETMYAAVTKLNVPFQFRELQKYMDEPSLVKVYNSGGSVLDDWRGLVWYSNQLVALNNSRLKETKKNQKLAEFIVEARQRLIKKGTMEDVKFDTGGFDTVLDNIRTAPTFLQGIDAASPLVDAIVLTMDSQIDSVSSLVPVVIAGFQRRIEADQRSQKRNILDLRALQAQFHHVQVLFYRARLEEPGAFDSLLAADPSLKEYLNPRGAISSKNWKDAEEALNLRLERIYASMQQLLSVEAQFYVARMKEVQEWREDLDAKITIARDGLTVWSQSHHNLGEGIPVPPLIDVASIAGSLAKKVIPAP